jgi:hypothetical protein
MSDNTKLKKAIRARQAETGGTYSTARMHILAGLPVPERTARTTEPEGPPRFDYHSHGPDRSPTGMSVLTRKPLEQPVMACTSCGYFAPRSIATGARCATPNCTGTLYEWLHPDRVEVLDPSVVARALT